MYQAFLRASEQGASGGGGDRGEVGVSILEGSEASTPLLPRKSARLTHPQEAGVQRKTRAPVSFSSAE